MRARTMLRRLKKIPPIVEKRFPPAGPCGLCGFEDKRHRMFDSIAGMVAAGDTIVRVARSYDLPVSVVREIVEWWK